MRAQTATSREVSLWWPLIILAAVLLLLALAPALSQEANPDAEITLFNEGSILYQRNCTNCHGPRAKGDGQVARLLTIKPADLTQLALNNDGVFPAEHVQETIDGRKGVAGHGMRDMPIWGDVFLSENGGPDAEAAAQRKIQALVVYLKKIQAK